MSGNMMEATTHLSVQTSATMEATKKTGWQTPQTLATMGAAMQASRHLGSKDKRQPVKDDEQREEKMIVGQHYHCAAYYQTGCQAQWTGSHGWWANGVKNGKEQFICEACQVCNSLAGSRVLQSMHRGSLRHQIQQAAPFQRRFQRRLIQQMFRCRWM